MPTSADTVLRLVRRMRLVHVTIEVLAAAQETDADAFEAVDDAVGWHKLLRARDQVRDLYACLNI